MSSGVTTLRRAALPEEEISRLLDCTVCGQFVRVYEVPPRWLDETRFVCGECMTEVDEPQPAAPEAA